MADSESFSKYLDIDIESCKNFYDSSSTLLSLLKNFDSSIDIYIDDYISFNNAKVSAQPTTNKVLALLSGFKKIDIMPSNIAYDWYKKINNQIECDLSFEELNKNLNFFGIKLPIKISKIQYRM